MGTLLLSSQAGWAASDEGGAVVSGVVKDSQGTAQMGALVQVLGANTRTIATAFTDLHGHYAFANLVPGRYEVRASAALFVPAARANLQLRTGAKAVVNLTLAALFDTASWLPASRRRADEPEDDWQWTLRSTANRPILRIVEEDGVLVVSSVPETPHGRVIARDAVEEGGGFGQAGIHDVISLHRTSLGGSESTLRADLGAIPAQSGGVPTAAGNAVEIEAGLDRQNGYGGGSRTVAGFASHPELLGPGGVQGIDVLELRSGQQLALGENVELEVGGEVQGVRSGASTVAAHPFLRLTAHPGGSWRLQYRMATSRDTQEFADIKAEHEDVPAAVQVGDKLQLEAGRHQELSVSRKAGRATVEVAYYHDAIQRMAVAGAGNPVLPAATPEQDGSAVAMPVGIEVDPLTGTFRSLVNGYTGNGARVSFNTPVAHGIWIAAEYETGNALASDTAATATLTEAMSGLRARDSQALAIAFKDDLKSTGTRIRASYRWQPEGMVTAVDPYGALGDQAYLSCFVRQRLRFGSWLPSGFDATIDVTNLLAQGYRPFLSADGHTLYFAQAPRTLQAGLSFTF